MAGQTHIVVPDSHAHPSFNNDRADWLGKLILDVKPDTVVHIGDNWDMPSMSSYDKGKKSFYGRSYRADLDSGIEFNERMWAPIKRAKKRLPYRIFCEGNHEYRMKRALELSPELEGTIGFDDFELDRYYDEVVEYTGGTPGVTQRDGINYAHYLISGLKGLPIGGEHHAASLISKHFESCTVGHSHTTDFAVRANPHGRKLMGLVCGVYQDYEADWAGESNNLWFQGVVVKREVENGQYAPQWITMSMLRDEYGK
tara:strand:+ start:1592 stop:2359 length:768 start_codon:yes stop_codon:yes gene_type:complete